MLSAVVKNLPFKVLDRTFIAMIATNSLLLVVPPNSPFKTLDDVAAELKKDPSNFTWTSQGGAATSDLVFRKFAKAVGVDIGKTKPVTARGTPEITTLTAGGQVKLGVLVIATALPAIQGGLIKPLALAADDRSTSLPDIPTAGELGYPTIATLSFTGLSGPPKLPDAIVQKWATEIDAMLKDPAFVAQLNKIGSIPFYMGPAEFHDYIAKESDLVQSLYPT
jgi:tripartite-type tricarboxylate transporter receptor subunit TctC